MIFILMFLAKTFLVTAIWTCVGMISYNVLVRYTTKDPLRWPGFWPGLLLGISHLLVLVQYYGRDKKPDTDQSTPSDPSDASVTSTPGRVSKK
jgi:hypothetical protein